MENVPETPPLNASSPTAMHRMRTKFHLAFAEVFTIRAARESRAYKNGGICILALIVMEGFLAVPARSQQMSKLDRSIVIEMLDEVSRDVQKHYYDHNFHGLDWNAKVCEARERIRVDKSLDVALVRVAAVLDSLNDSHTFFHPPQCLRRHEYGFRTEMVGNRCYVAHVRRGSDAEAKGLKCGDQVLSLAGWHPSRENYWRMDYLLTVLRPQSNIRVILSDTEGRSRQVDVTAKFEELLQVTDLTPSDENEMQITDTVRRAENEQHLMRARTAKMDNELIILNLPRMMFSQEQIDGIIGKARKYPALIVDLRGNLGGTIQALKFLVGCIFDHDIRIADRMGRKEMKPEVAKSMGGRAFKGKLVVLVDSRSASASELFARIVQLQRRGIVVGDCTSGRVMEARRYSYHFGTEVMVPFGASITESDLIMSDGKSLEHCGVTPDEIVLPSAADMANDRDPALSRAAALLGVKLNSQDAGKLLPYEWPAE